MKTWIVLLLAACSLTISAQQNLLTDANVDRSVLLVKHRLTATDQDIDDFHRQQGNKAKKFDHVKWSVVRLGPNDGRIEENYRNSRLFQRVDYARRYQVDAVPNDPLYPQLWGLQKIQAASAWDVTTGSDVIVAVIDTGIDFNHEDLRANLWTGPAGEHGYTASFGAIYPGGEDDHLHGTHVAGTIGAVGNNALGVVGINWRVQLAAFKFISSGGFGFDSDAVLCIEKIVDLKLQGYNFRVSNNSWGGSGVSAILEDAFTLAQQAGVLNVCAAGNDGRDIDLGPPFYPAAIPISGIVSVLASDQNDNKAGFSNWGQTSTDILAPGVGIISCSLGGGYRTLNGTSMASPHVAGVCAALFGLNPNMNAAQCRTVLLNSNSLDITAFKDNTTSGGRLNMAKAVRNPVIVQPPENHDPVLTITPSTNLIVVAIGETASVTSTATDPDTNALTYVVSARSGHMGGPYGWLIRRTIGDPAVPAQVTNVLTVTNKPISREVATSARFAVTDGNGGAAVKQSTILYERDENLVAPLPIFFVSLEPPVDSPYPLIRVSTSEILSTPTWYSYYIFSPGQGFGQTCCWPVNTANELYANLPEGPNVIRAQVMDEHGNFKNSERLVIDKGNTGRYAPEIKIRINTVRGQTPLNVVADMSETDPGDAHHLTYTSMYWRETAIIFDIRNPVRRFTLVEPGNHPIEFMAYDPVGGVGDVHIEMFTVLPSGLETNQPPPVQLIAPSDLRVSQFGASLILSWTDTSIGEDRWEIQWSSKFKGPWTGFRPLANLNADSSSYSLATTVGQYQFRIRACKATACSPYSNIVNIRVR